MSTESVRQIGLSLGADICWPASYEEIVKQLDLRLDLGGERVRFHVERVSVEPYDLAYKPKYDLVIDRLTHWYMISREWIKKIALMDGVYVLNNPWSIQANEKHTTYCAMMRLGFPIPETWMIPAKEYDWKSWDTETVVKKYNRLFDLGKVGAKVGYPAFLKPYDGGGWVGVSRVTDAASLHAAYDKSGQRIQHLQAGVKDWDLFIRGVGLGPQVWIAKYDPDQPLHGRYVAATDFLSPAERARAEKTTRVINAFFAWDFNSCEMLRAGGTFHPIDFANACPDSQVTSLHFYFPDHVKNILRWTLFCAATKRKVKLNADWAPYLAIADMDLSFDEKLDRYDAIARAWFDADRFEEFCATHLSTLDEVAHDFFGTARFRDIVREKVAALYPKHEIEPFTDHFFGKVQDWRRHDAARRAAR